MTKDEIVAYLNEEIKNLTDAIENHDTETDPNEVWLNEWLVERSAYKKILEKVSGVIHPSATITAELLFPVDAETMDLILHGVKSDYHVLNADIIE